MTAWISPNKVGSIDVEATATCISGAGDAFIKKLLVKVLMRYTFDNAIIIILLYRDCITKPMACFQDNRWHAQESS